MYGMPAFGDPLGTITGELDGLPGAGSAAPSILPRFCTSWKCRGASCPHRQRFCARSATWAGRRRRPRRWQPRGKQARSPSVRRSGWRELCCRQMGPYGSLRKSHTPSHAVRRRPDRTSAGALAQAACKWPRAPRRATGLTSRTASKNSSRNSSESRRLASAR